MVQAKGVDDRLRERPHFGLLGRIQIAGQHGCIANTFDPLILGAQDVEAAFGYQADRRCCFFEVFKNARLLLVLQAVFLEFHLAFWVCKGLFSCSEKTVKGAKIQNHINLRKRISVHGNDDLRWINPVLYLQKLYFFGMVAIGLWRIGIDYLAHTVLKTEAGDGVGLILAVDQKHIFSAIHRKPPALRYSY